MKVVMIGGVIENEGSLTLQTPRSFFSRFRVDMRGHHEVVAIHADSKTVGYPYTDGIRQRAHGGICQHSR